jgi:hypothetical protein
MALTERRDLAAALLAPFEMSNPVYEELVKQVSSSSADEA